MDSFYTILEWKGSHSVKLNWNSIQVKILNSSPFEVFSTDYFFIDEPNEVLVFLEGEVYNHLDVLKKLGLSIEKIKNPELVYAAFLKWGSNFADQLNGDFAICIYQRKKNEVLFFRDHLGIRPISVSLMEDAIYFASDPMGLAKALYSKEKIASKYLLNYFSSEDGDSTLMPNKKLIKVKPGHYLRVTSEQVEQIKYWFPERNQTDQSLTQEKVIKDLSLLVRDATNIRVDYKYNAGAHLSGGLDSGVVAALARQAYGHQDKFYGFSWSPDSNANSENISHDERLFVEKTASLNNIDLVFSSMDSISYHAFVSDWRHPSEMIYERKTVQAAKDRDVNLIFSGWGGDEFISIGHRGIDADLIRQGDWRSFFKKYPIQNPRRLISALFFSALFPSLRRGYSKYKSDPAIYPYIKKVIGSNIIPKKKRFQYHSRRKVHLQLLEYGHLGARAADWYVHGQRNGVEYRYPLLDKRIVEYMLKVPSKCLVGNNHYRILLREIGKDLLPEEVLKNSSKDDPLKSKQFYKMVSEVKKQFISELTDFRNNPDLDFVDFKLLEKNLPTILDNIEKGKEEDGSAIFYYLKVAHEFTKGYYN